MYTLTRAIGHARQRGDAHVLRAVEQQVLVRLVAHHPEIALDRDLGDAP